MPDNSALIKEIDSQLKSVMPTPTVAQPVIWYRGGKEDAPVAAQVTAVEAPGRVSLIVFSVDAFPVHVKGCHHRSWPEHQRPGNVNTVQRGAWDYPNGTIPEADLAAHKQQLKEKLAKARETHTPAKEAVAAK